MTITPRGTANTPARRIAMTDSRNAKDYGAARTGTEVALRGSQDVQRLIAEVRAGALARREQPAAPRTVVTTTHWSDAWLMRSSGTAIGAALACATYRSTFGPVPIEMIGGLIAAFLILMVLVGISKRVHGKCAHTQGR